MATSVKSAHSVSGQRDHEHGPAGRAAWSTVARRRRRASTTSTTMAATSTRPRAAVTRRSPRRATVTCRPDPGAAGRRARSRSGRRSAAPRKRSAIASTTVVGPCGRSRSSTVETVRARSLSRSGCERVGASRAVGRLLVDVGDDQRDRRGVQRGGDGDDDVLRHGTDPSVPTTSTMPASGPGKSVMRRFRRPRRIRGSLPAAAREQVVAAARRCDGAGLRRSASCAQAFVTQASSCSWSSRRARSAAPSRRRRCRASTWTRATACR